MPPSAAKTILLIELLDTDPPYNTTEVLKTFVGKLANDRINVMGKKIICSFGSPDLAAGAAIDLMGLDFPGKKPGQQIARMSVCQMPLGVEGKDAQTQAATTAVRELVKAKAGQIVTTQDTAGNLSSQFEVKFGTSDISAGQRIFEILPPANQKQEEMTRVASLGDRGGKKLRLVWKLSDQTKKEMALYAEHPLITFGRDEVNDIVLENNMVSRRHGLLEFRKGSIYISDNSTNGTFVFPEAGVKFKLHKGERPLPLRGYFCLGEELDANHPLTIHFVTVFSAN